jgi:hypothetical protein
MHQRSDGVQTAIDDQECSALARFRRLQEGESRKAVSEGAQERKDTREGEAASGRSDVDVRSEIGRRCTTTQRQPAAAQRRTDRQEPDRVQRQNGRIERRTSQPGILEMAFSRSFCRKED